MEDRKTLTGDDGVTRCHWAGNDPQYVAYHDTEWGFGVTNDDRLFEKICLEGFQAGLSWLTILRKRDNFRAAFANFDIAAVAQFDELDVDRLVNDAGIIRHRGKIESAIRNAQCALNMQAEHGSISSFFWEHAEVCAEAVADVPAKTALSTELSRTLKKLGWSFVGPTTMYAFLQAMGVVNDHVVGCDSWEAAETSRREIIASLG